MTLEEQEGLGVMLKGYKKAIYRLSVQLVNSKLSNKIFYLLIIIETLQLLAYQCHEVFDYNGLATDQFRTLTHFVNPEYYLKHTNLMEVIIPFSAFIVICHVSILGFGLKKQREIVFLHGDQNRDQNNKGSIVYSIGHWYTIVFITILTTPVFLPSLLVFYCNQSNPYFQSMNMKCYSTYHIFLIILAIINIVWVLAINIYGSLFYYTFNPIMHQNVMSLSSPLFNVLKLVLKVVPPAYLIFDPTLQYSILFVVGIMIGLLGYTAISRVLYPYTRYNQTDDKVILYIEVIAIFISALFILSAFFNEEQGLIITFIVSIIVPFPIAKAGHQFIMNNKQKLILKINEHEKQNTQGIQQLVCYIIAQLENSKLEVKDKRFLKMIRIHNQECENITCSCHEYLNKVGQHFMNHHTQKELIYKILLQIIDHMLEENKKAYSLLILKGYIEFYQLESTTKAAFVVSKILNEKISFFENYLIHAFLYEVTKTYHDSRNVETYRLFGEHSIMFEKQIVKLAQNYAEFWQQISEQNSSLKKIMNILKSTQKSKQIIHFLFQTLHKIYPSNIHILNIYKELFRQVLIDYEQYVKYNSLYQDSVGLRQEFKTMKTERFIKFSPNQNLVVINTSVNVSSDIFHGGCEIVSVTNNVHNVLGYSSQDLIGKNINRFLPKIYAEFHDDIINNYLNKEDHKHKIRDLVVFPLNSNGNVVECAMIVKIMPSLEHGVNIVSFLLNRSKFHQNLIIYDQRTGLIDSMTEKAESLLMGGRSKKSSLAIPDHINDILPSWDHINETMGNNNNMTNSRQIELTYDDIRLYRSDGPQEDKFVKVLNFRLQFESRMFSMKSTQNPNLCMSFQQIANIFPNNENQMKEDFLKGDDNIQEDDDLMASANPIVKGLMGNLQLMAKSEKKQMYKGLRQCYPKVYLVFQISFVAALLGLIIWNYAGTLSYYQTLQNDISIKQNIADAGDFVIQATHSASHYIFSGGEPVILSQVNITDALDQLNELQSIGQFIYQQIVYKQQLGQISISELMLNVTYYTSQPSQTKNSLILQEIKQKTVTDASYQLVMYLIEVYKSSDPVDNLQNNILFMFKNSLNITEQFRHLNEVFTSNLQQNSINRKSFIISIFGFIMGIFILSIIWQLIYKLAVINKINQVITIYEYIPTSQLSRFPAKCEKFIKYVCPIDKEEDIRQKTRKMSILSMVKGSKQNALQNVEQQKQPKQQQKQQQIININSKNLQQKKNNQQQLQQQTNQLPLYSLLQQDEQIEYISFSSKLSTKTVIFQAFIFVLGFSVMFAVNLVWENGVITENFKEVADWNMISEFKSAVIQIAFVMNEVENRGGQWSVEELVGLRGDFDMEINTIQAIIKKTSLLDSYLSSIFQLLQQSILILNSPNITAQQFILNEQKLNLLFQTVANKQIHTKIEPNIATTVTNFTTLLQLIFIAQIIIFLLYAILYLPKSFLKYREQHHIAQLMFNTLGRKLQNVAQTHFKIK